MSKRELPSGFESRRTGDYGVAALIELRDSDKGGPVIDGHAAVFDRLSDDLGGFREKIAPGAFRDAIEVSDVRALFNHDSNFVLGRTKSGTLEIREDEQGLYTVTQAPENDTIRHMVLDPIRRGDVDQMSFAFRIKADGDHWEETDEGMVRTIKPGGVAELYDISPVTYPAYPDTAVAVRSLKTILEQDAELSKRMAWLEYERRRRELELMDLAADL